MKKYSYLFFILILTTLTSCLKSGMEDLPEFEGNDITAVRKVEYRFKGTNTSGVSGEAYLEYQALKHTEQLDKDAKTLDIQITVPASDEATQFTAAKRAECTIQNIAIMVSIETAARIVPIGDAPRLGIPEDWSKPNKYLITAANGNTAEWTITVTSFTK
ncbi:MAG: hypothetical protein LUE99_04260 [Bacteroides sp.]|nr:hypothetical protein [Bacteroides sp.]